jgi:hypothetical protein
MKKILFAFILFATACNNSSAPENSKGETYFNFEVDGKSFSIKEENISSTYHDFNDHTEFKIFAGADGAPSLILTIIAPMKGASSTPSGSEQPGNAISQGSVSLQNYPQKGETFNSYDFMDSNKSAPVADAINITSIEPDGKEASIIAGTVSTNTVASANDPLKKVYRITGKFKIRHQFSGDRF